MDSTEEKNRIIAETNRLVTGLFHVVGKYRSWEESEIQLRAVLCDISHVNDGTGVSRLTGGHFVFTFNIHWFNEGNHAEFDTHPLLVTLFKRYSDFLGLSVALQTAYPGLVQFQIPPKTLKSKTEQLGHEEALMRAISFTVYLNLIFLNKELQESHTVADFIKRVPDTRLPGKPIMSTLKEEALAATNILTSLWTKKSKALRPVATSHKGINELHTRLEELAAKDQLTATWETYTLNLLHSFDRKFNFCRQNDELLAQVSLKNSFGADLGMVQMQAEQTQRASSWVTDYLKTICQALKVD